MSTSNCYDVTTWPQGDPYEDVGGVINGIIADIKARQTESDAADGGKPGAVIYLPPGDYRLRTQVHIDISFLRIQGAGHGFTSSSIRFNVPDEQRAELHELWPGGSRILVDLPMRPAAAASERAAFRVERDGSPRISSVEFVDFCIDGLHFTGEGPGNNPENSYINGKTGILVASANDSVRITGMGMVYLEHALAIHHADALSVHDNFIAECGNGVELRGWGQASKVSDNLIGAGPQGYSIFAENHGGLLVTSNNVFPRGSSSVHLEGVIRSSVTNNRLHSFYPGMVVLGSGSSENLIATNHFLRDEEPWTPFTGVSNGLDDLAGLLSIDGSFNSIIGNHFSAIIAASDVRPAAEAPVVIRLVAGEENYVANNHVVARDVSHHASDSCFEAQVGALLSTQGTRKLAVTTVRVDDGAVRNTILDSGTGAEVAMDRSANAFRPTPSIGA